MKSVLAWHFTGDKLRNGEAIPKQGEWLEIDGKPIMCKRGLHASRHPYDALKHAPGAALHRVRLDGTILIGNDKLVATRRKIIWTLPPEIMQPLMWDFVRYCARSVLHLWDAPDVVKQYLKTGDESLKAASLAASRATLRAASRDASWDASRAALWDASRDASRAASWAASGAASWDASRAAVWAASRAASQAASWDASGAAEESKHRKYILAAIIKERKANR